jgi:hypothetical protein
MGAPHETIETNLTPPSLSQKDEAKAALITAQEFIVQTTQAAEKPGMPTHIQEKLLNLAGEAEMEYQQLENLRDALTVADQELPLDVVAQGRDLHTTYETKNTQEDKALIEKKIDPYMQEAIYLVFSALKDRKHPAGIQGSLAFVLDVGDRTAKIPGDIDMYAAVQDFPSAYEFLKARSDSGEIVDLKVTVTKNLEGQVNHGFEVSGNVRTGANGAVLKQFSIFFQNIDPARNPNGRVVNLGIEDRHFLNYEVKGKNGEVMEVPFGDTEGSVAVNLRSILWELRLVQFENYKESKRHALGVSAKFLQRFSNLMVLLEIPESNSFNVIIDLLDKEVQNSNNPEFRDAVEMLITLKNDFDQLNHKGKGLTESICSKYEIDQHCNEKSLDLMTQKINERMKDVLELSLKAEKIFLDDSVPPQKRLDDIHAVLGDVEKVYDKYRVDLGEVNNANSRDFGAYMALKALKDQFIWKAAEQLLGYDTILKQQINN